MANSKDLAFSLSDLNPLHWLGSAASAAVGDVWKAAMTALWSAGLWVLGLAMKVIDAFTTPDLSTDGPLARVLPYTFAIGAFLAVLLGLVQIGVAAWKRDGQSIARVMVGTVQFWGVWVGYCAIGAILVTATSGLTHGLLSALLHVDAFSGVPASANWPTKIDDTVVATVLGLCTVFVIFPASIGYVLLMLVREAALLILASTSPISAAGLLAESTRAWFWKSFRWFLATLLMAPLAALVLGIGIQICEGTIEPPEKPKMPASCHELNDPFNVSDQCLKAISSASNNFTIAQVGMAVTGCLIILIGAICPLLLFRLLAFVDPGTPSGVAMRASFAANGGMAGLLSAKGAAASGEGQSSGSGAATKQDDTGRSAGEASADTQTASRFSSMLGGAGQIMGAGMQAVGKVTTKAAAVGSDVLGSAGVGHQAPYFGQDTDISGRSGSGGSPGTSAATGTGTGGSGPDGPGGSGGSAGSGGGDGGTPTPPTPPMPQPPAPPHGGGGGGGLPGAPGGGSSGAGGAGAEGAGVAAEVPVVPV